MSRATETANNPALIIIRGLPGGGKSYLAAALQNELGKDDVVILDPDEIDFDSQKYKALSESLTAEGVELKFHPNRFLKQVGYEAIASGKYVIWTQAFTDLGGFKRSIGSLEEFAANHNIHLPVLVVEVEISEEAAKKRVMGRAGQGGHDVTEEAFRRFINDYRSFAGEGYATITIDGERPVDESVSTVLDALRDSV